MATTNRYQQFLRETLKPGIQAFLADQKLPDDFPVSQRSLEIFIKSFRSGLPQNLKNELPPHNLKNKQYLQELLKNIDFFLGEAEASGDDEKIGSTVPVLKNILEAQGKEREVKIGAVAGIQRWKSNLQQQIREHNRIVIQGLISQQLKQQKEFQAVKNQTRLDQLSANIAATIQNDHLLETDSPDVDVEDKVKSIIRQAVNEQAKQVPAEEENEWLEITARPQGTDQVAIVMAKEVSPQVLKIKEQTSSKEEEFAQTAPLPPAPSLKTMEIDVQAALRENMPFDIKPQAVNEILATATPEIMFRLGGAGKNPQAYLTQAVAAVFNLPKVQKIFTQQKISPAQTAAAVKDVAQYMAEDAQAFVAEGGVGGSPLGGGMAGFTPGGGAPPSGGGYAAASHLLFPEGSIEDVFYSSGQPLHLFTALASPHSAVDFGKWLITAGPIRSAIGFIYDSTPGASRLNYFNVGLGLIFQSQRQLEQSIEHIQLSGNERTYQNQQELQEAKQKLSFINEQINALRKIPGFEKFYNFYYGSWGRLLHPLDSLQLWAINKNIFAGLGVSGVVQALSWAVQYGPTGFAYGIEQMPVQLGLLALKWGLSKTGLYKVVGLPGSRHYVFAPTYELGLWAKKLIYKKILQPIKVNVGLGLRKLGRKLKIPGFVTAGRKIIGGLVGKLLAALMKFLGFLGLAWGLVKALWNKIIKPGVLFLFYLLLTHGLWAGAGALGGLLLGLPFAAKAFALTFGFFSPFISPFLAWIPASVAFVATEVVFLVFGAGAGALLHGLWDGFAANWTAAAANFSLSKAALGLSGYVFPVFVTTGGLLAGGYFYANWILQSSFALLQFPQAQSEHILVKKDVHPFSGKLGQETIRYTLTIGPKKIDEKLINMKISDITSSSCANTPPVIAERNFLDKIPAEITFATPLSITYDLPTDNSFNDCLITNTATVTADVENGPTGEQSFYTAGVTIGNPPVDLPSGWPVGAACITQGPNGSTSHARYREEALDINGSLINKPVLATHNGTVSRVVNNQNTSTTGYGNYVILQGVGQNGKVFSTLYAHLMTVSVANGQKIKKGALIGTVGSSGNTGTPPGPHLHYEFLGLKLEPPFIPTDAFNPANINNIRGCSLREACNLCF